MPQMDIVQFSNPGNVEIINEVRGELGGDFANRVPAATQANLSQTMNAMWEYQPALNQFIDALFNKLLTQIIRSNSWQNPLAPFKVGLLGMGESIEEVNVGLLKAKTYNAEAEALAKELFGREPNNVQTAYHKVNREEYYKLTINEAMLERAFLNEGGLSRMLNELMQSVNTSDEWDEYLQTVSTLQRYYDAGGFFKQNVPNIAAPTSDGNDSKQFLRTIRSFADKLPFISDKYNARHMPRRALRDELVLITTADAKAAFDVEALAAAFNVGNMNIGSRIITLPDEHIRIPGFQGLLTTERFFVIADKLIRMGSVNNPAGLYNNYFYHHQEIISASPFEQAILLTSEEQTAITVIDYRIDGINPFTVTDITTDDEPVVTVTGDAATLERGHAYVVATSAITAPTGGPADGVILSVSGNTSRRTRVNNMGILIIGFDEQSSTIVVNAAATADQTFERDITFTLTGAVVLGGVNVTIDENPGVINNTRKPGISPQGGPVGTVLVTNNGSWDTTDLSFAYQWLRDGAPISGATANEYTTVTADGGHELSVTVTASKAGQTAGTATANSVTITA